ncbi:MAG: oxidoreductase [Cyanobacteria bacterium P01_A01_bin.45]
MSEIQKQKTQNQQIVLVTGASSGFGKAITEFLAKKGYYIFASARSMEKLEAMRTENIEPLQLDVTDNNNIQAAIERITSTKGHLDILINNAGYGLYGTLEGITQEQARQVFDVNLFGLAQMTQAVLPIMRSQKSGTIINLSSVVGKVSMPFMGWYAASKHAVEALTDALRLEVKQFGIKVVLIEPGAINTGFEEVAMNTLDDSNDPEVYGNMRSAFANLIGNTYKNAPYADVVTETIYKAIKISNPKARYSVGNDARMLIPVRRFLGDRLFDLIVSSQFK